MKCENCGNDHDGSYGSGRFCNSKCARGFSTKENRDEINKKVSITHGGTGQTQPKEKYCLNCNKQINRHKNFCNATCQHAYKRKIEYKQYENSGCFPSKHKARAYLINKHGNICQICGISEWRGEKVPLVMDHIDGNSDNHSFDNCRIICRNCDGLLPTYCNGNKNAKGTKRSIKRNALYHKSKQR